MNRIYTQYWIDNPKEIREHLRGVFGIPKTGIAEIRDQIIISDGVTNDDLGVVTKERMAAYVGSDEEFSRLWELTLAKARYELNPPTMIIGEDIAPVIETEDTPIEPVTPTPEPTVVIPEPTTPFCDSCDSKGVRHKKECIYFISIRKPKFLSNKAHE